MTAFFREFFALCRRYRRPLILAALICIAVIAVVYLVLAYEVRQSSFCDSCHYMDPYVRHWESSTHSQVECVKCHDYGVTDLTSSTIQYIVGTYNSRPKADVPDENCLSSDCHDEGLLEGTIEYRRGILFDHAVHHNEILRGEKLRCTSCHNQIVQYDDDAAGHMAVNDKSCFVCHFKDAGVGEAITGCNSCHGMPEQEVEHAGFIFSHKPYLELGVECKMCHVNIVRGDGSVPESMCYSCHVEESRTLLSRTELHDIHVTGNGIDCYRCHTDIEHGNFSMASALDIDCENCHLRQHNKPKQLYMGIGGRDSIDMPSAMFAAQVSCTGCHTHLTPEGEMMARQEKREASRKSCVTCHEEGYDLMFDNWREGSKKVLADYGKFISAAKSDFAAIGGDKKARVKVREALRQAEYHYGFVLEGHLPHNIQYGLYLLNGSAERFELAMKEIRKGYQGPQRGDALKSENTCTVFCHGKALRPEEVPYEGGELPHLLHIEDMEVSCKACHSVSEHGKTEINQSVCEDCH